MCLTIPKKVISVYENKISVERWDGKERQDISTIIEAKKDDWVLTQGGVAIEKISNEQAQEIINLIKDDE